MDFLFESKQIFEEVVKLRRELHQNPEIGSDLPITSSIIKRKLDEFGCTYKEPVKNNFVVLLGRPGKTLLVRADTDALPNAELSGLPFASQNGNSHSCGHDIHTSSMLGAIKILKAHESELAGTVKFVFQADEERILGAKALIKAGVMEEPHVDAVLGMHTEAGLKAGMFNVDRGPFLASSDIFKITVIGKSAHGSSPENGVDPILIGAKIVDSAQTITARQINALDPVVITFGFFNSGDAPNIIPDNAVLQGTIRTFGKAARDTAKRRLSEMADDIARVYGGRAEFEVVSSTPVTFNEPHMTEQMYRYALELLGSDFVKIGDNRFKASDDFAYYSEIAPGVMYHVGMGDSSQGCCFSLHNPRIIFNEQALLNCTACYAYLPYMWLKENK